MNSSESDRKLGVTNLFQDCDGLNRHLNSRTSTQRGQKNVSASGFKGLNGSVVRRSKHHSMIKRKLSVIVEEVLEIDSDSEELAHVDSFCATTTAPSSIIHSRESSQILNEALFESSDENNCTSMKHAEISESSRVSSGDCESQISNCVKGAGSANENHEIQFLMDQQNFSIEGKSYLRSQYYLGSDALSALNTTNRNVRVKSSESDSGYLSTMTNSTINLTSTMSTEPSNDANSRGSLSPSGSDHSFHEELLERLNQITRSESSSSCETNDSLGLK